MPLSPRSFVRLAALAIVAVACTADRINAPAATAVDAPLAALMAPDVPQLVITEIMPDPSRVGDNVGEWFEVFNGGETDVDLKDYWIYSGPNVTTPERHRIATSVIVPAGGLVVLGNNTNQSTNGGAPVAYAFPGTAGQSGAITLNNSNTDWLSLRMPDEATVLDYVSYSQRDATGNLVTGGSSFSPSAGISRVLVDAAQDNAQIAASANWINTPVGTTYGLGDRGTPGLGQYQVLPPGEVVAVEVAPSPAAVTPGGTRQLSATARDANGRFPQTIYTWSSANQTIATVSNTGLVTGVAEGSTTITAKAANGVPGSATVNVQPPVAAALSISINFPDTLPVGYTKPAFATVRDAGGTIIPTPKLTWTSGNPDAFTIDSLGYITALAVGQGSVSATAPNGVTGSWFAPFVIIPADAPNAAVYRDHLAFGTPEGDNVMKKRQFALSYSPTRGGPNWVSWNINATQFGAARRCDCFTADVTIPGGAYRVVDFDYRNSGWDRGHMVQSESRTATNQENATTFLLTNILPQAGENNQGPWSRHENYLNDLAREADKEIYVVAGGLYSAQPATLKGEGKVQIPKSTWKVAAIMAAGSGPGDIRSAADVELSAIEISNEASPGIPIVGIRNNPWEQYRVTVDMIEAATGYDLLANLPDYIEKALEKGDRAPVAKLVAPSNGVEGSQLPFDALQSSDPDPGDVLTYEWDFGDGTTATGVNPTHVYSDNGNYTVTLRVIDRDGADAIATQKVAVANAAPVIASFDVSSLVSARAPATVSVGYTDVGSADTHVLSVSWGDGSTSSIAGREGLAEARHSYAAAGFYTVTVTLTDDDGASASRTATEYVIVYDAAAGFVTGGGFVGAGGGLLKGNQKATFTASLRFADGDAPEGHVNVNVLGRQIDFKTDAVEWMVVRGNQAFIKGVGTIADQSGSYQVLLALVDGGSDDKVRIRIWNDAGTVYDNQPGAAIPTPATTSLGGGNVTVHRAQ